MQVYETHAWSVFRKAEFVVEGRGVPLRRGRRSLCTVMLGLVKTKFFCYKKILFIADVQIYYGCLD